MDVVNNNVSFQAKPGKRLLKKINKEFNNDTQKVNRYVQLFEDTFSPNLDKETIIDINKDNYLVFSNNNFPNTKYRFKSKLRSDKNIAQTLIKECPRDFSYAEGNLFKVIIKKCINSGIEIPAIRNKAESCFANPKRRDVFLEKLKVAERIKKEDPQSTLEMGEFDYMQNVITQEEMDAKGMNNSGIKLEDFILNLD